MNVVSSVDLEKMAEEARELIEETKELNRKSTQLLDKKQHSDTK